MALFFLQKNVFLYCTLQITLSVHLPSSILHHFTSTMKHKHSKTLLRNFVAYHLYKIHLADAMELMNATYLHCSITLEL